jgi:fatty-acyl-CoA synthase
MPAITPTTTGPIYTSNLSAPFLDTARRNPNSTALVFNDQEMSNADLVSQIDRTVETLMAYGIEPGDRVAYLGSNHPMLLITLLATARMGAVFVALNSLSTAMEARYILRDSDARAVIAGVESQAVLDEIRNELPCKAYIGVEDGSADWNVLSVRHIRADNGISRHPIAQTQADDVAVLLYTSGTTGKPKGAMITHGNVWATSMNVQILLKLSPQTSMLAMAPMFHIGSLAYALATLAMGGKTVILSGFDPDAVYHAIDRWNVSMFFGVPTMLQALERHPLFASTDFEGITITAAGAPVPVAMLETWSEAGARILQGYGMTEGGGTILDADKGLDKIGSAGLPLPLTEIELRNVDTDQVIRNSDEAGQIWMRGPTITRGYWNLPEETAKAFDQVGWFATGDVGRWDEDGYLYIIDRIKDMIISGGVNVYPAEVERVLNGHPDISSAAVIGVPDEKWGERVTAVIVTDHPQAISKDEILTFCRRSLSAYKIPRQIEFAKSLPMGSTGKILKWKLRSGYC